MFNLLKRRCKVCGSTEKLIFSKGMILCPKHYVKQCIALKRLRELKAEKARLGDII